MGDAIDDCDDPDTLSRVSDALKFMSGSANTRRHYADAARIKIKLNHD